MGAPDDGIALANLFLAKGDITYVQGQNVPRQDFDADAAKDITSCRWWSSPIVARRTARKSRLPP